MDGGGRIANFAAYRYWMLLALPDVLRREWTVPHAPVPSFLDICHFWVLGSKKRPSGLLMLDDFGILYVYCSVGNGNGLK